MRSRAGHGHRARGDAGAAAIEFITIGVLLMVPLVYLVITLGRIQAASLAAQAGARASARAMTTAPTTPSGRAQADVAARIALTDQGFSQDDAQLTIQCSASPCLTPSARVEARLDVSVVLPLVPAFVDRLVPVRVTVTGTQVSVVDRFRRGEA